MGDLLSDMKDLPRNATVRKVNEIVKRARMAKVHAYIISHLKQQMPSMFGKDKKQAELIENLDVEFMKIHKQHNLPIGDFPDIERFKQSLKNFNFSEFAKLNTKLIQNMDEVLSVDLPKLMALFPQGNPSLPTHQRNPFADYIAPGASTFSEEQTDPWSWDSVEKSRYVDQFNSLNPIDGKISGSIAKPVLMQSELPVADLGTIWALSDLTRDGYLDLDEFSLALHLIKLKQSGLELPKMLPETLRPPKGKI
jgi:EH domain-containing protein 3/EH domain-containing protein 1